MKYWMGIGISNEYVKILKNFPQMTSFDDNSEVLFILADEPNKKYNSLKKEKLAEDLQNISNKLKNKLSCHLNIKRWDYLSKNKKYNSILKMYKSLFKEEGTFRKDVLKLVFKNRTYFSKGKEEKLANYVLEELSSIVFLSRKGFVKIGPREKEKIFDSLAKKYSPNEDLRFNYF